MFNSWQYWAMSLSVASRTSATCLSCSDTRFKSIAASSLGLDYRHKSVNFDDYSLQLLLPQKQSTIDNALQVADVNKDGLDDVFEYENIPLESPLNAALQIDEAHCQAAVAKPHP